LAKVASGLSGILLMVASLASTMTSAATAADLTSNYYGGPAPYFAFSWAGPYVGATLGYEWGSRE
jgi:outer membrane immunogenic protein